MLSRKMKPLLQHIRFAALVAFVAGARRFFWHGPSLARTFALQLWASKFQGKPVLSHCRKHDLPVARQLWVSQQQGTPIMSNCREHELQAFWAFTSFATMAGALPLGNISSRFERSNFFFVRLSKFAPVRVVQGFVSLPHLLALASHFCEFFSRHSW